MPGRDKLPVGVVGSGGFKDRPGFIVFNPKYISNHYVSPGRCGFYFNSVLGSGKSLGGLLNSGYEEDQRGVEINMVALSLLKHSPLVYKHRYRNFHYFLFHGSRNATRMRVQGFPSWLQNRHVSSESVHQSNVHLYPRHRFSLPQYSNDRSRRHSANKGTLCSV